MRKLFYIKKKDFSLFLTLFFIRIKCIEGESFNCFDTRFQRFWILIQILETFRKIPVIQNIFWNFGEILMILMRFRKFSWDSSNSNEIPKIQSRHVTRYSLCDPPLECVRITSKIMFAEKVRNSCGIFIHISLRVQPICCFDFRLP